MELNLKGKIVQFDDEDADVVLKYPWYISNCNGFLYATTSNYVGNYRNEPFRMHQLIMGFPAQDVDHKNKDTLDNRRSNLRCCSRAQNNANSGSRKGTSKYKGVRFQAGKWTAQIMIDKKAIYLGRFSSEVDAARAYNTAAKEAWGEFAFQNDV